MVNLVGTLVSVLARISLLRSGRTSETLHELPDQQWDSDQEQIRKESTYNHHMGAEQSADKTEQYGSGVATAIGTHNPLRQDPTTPLRRRCASNPISKPPRKNRISPDSMAGIANSNSLDSKNPWSRIGLARPGVAGHRIRCRTAPASSSNSIEKKRKLLKDRVLSFNSNGEFSVCNSLLHAKS